MLSQIVLVVVLLAVFVAMLAGMAARHQQQSTCETPAPSIVLDPVVGEFIAAIHSCTSEADVRYIHAVTALQEDPTRSARQIEAAYTELGERHSQTKESLLRAATATAHAAMLPFLAAVAGRHSVGVARHDGGRAAAESMLRTVAVDGIDAIARTGDTAAADVLLALATSSDRAVQAMAIVALKYADAHSERFASLRDRLPADRLYLLDIVRAGVRDVPQVADPCRHLAGEETTTDLRPGPDPATVRTIPAAPKFARSPRVPC